ncbi:MAG: sugar ABC transporter permease [Deltaproteobacteria bacterium]|nr:sugar ABC transporter permease [Deltaproteobacteria bacterium]
MRGPKEGIGYLFPAVAVLALVTIYPLGYLTYLSLHRKLLIFGISEFVGLENYAFLLRDERFWNALWNTVYFCGVSVAVELALGLGAAVLLNREFALKGFARALVLLPWAVPTVVSAKMWEWIYNSDFGILNYVLCAKVNWLGDPFLALNAAVAMDVWKTTPFVTVLLTGALQVIPRDLYRAARVDGASEFAVFRRITLPLLVPVLSVTLVFRALDAFRVFDAVYVLTGGGPANASETLSVYAYKVLFQTLQFGYGSALSTVVFLCVGGIAVAFVALSAGQRR